MPCTMTGSLSGDRILSLEEQLKEARAAGDEATRLLCEVLRLLPDGSLYYLFARIDHLQTWWEAHQEADQQQAEEEERAAVLARLSGRERRLLGLL